MLLLGLHAVQGAAPARHRPARRPDSPRRQRGRHPDPRRRRRPEAPRLLHLQLAGRQPGQVGRGHGHRADPRPRPASPARGRWRSPGWTATATRSRRGTPSCLPPAPPPTGRRSKAWPTSSTGPPGRPPPRRAVPGRLAVLGGGVAGTELAQAFARLGSAVTLVARGGLLQHLPGGGRETGAAGLRADGVELRLHTGTQQRPQERRRLPHPGRSTDGDHASRRTSCWFAPAGTPPWTGSVWKRGACRRRRQSRCRSAPTPPAWCSGRHRATTSGTVALRGGRRRRQGHADAPGQVRGTGHRRRHRRAGQG